MTVNTNKSIRTAANKETKAVTTNWNTEEMLSIVYDLNTTKEIDLTPAKLKYFADKLKPYANAKRVKNCIRVQKYGIMELMSAVSAVQEPKKVAERIGKKVQAAPAVKNDDKPAYVPFNGHSAGCGITYLLAQATKVTEAKAIVLVNRALKYLASDFEVELDDKVKLNKTNVAEISAKLLAEVGELVKDSKAACTKCESPKPVTRREPRTACPKCKSKKTEGNGFDRKQQARIYCKACGKTSVIK